MHNQDYAVLLVFARKQVITLINVCICILPTNRFFSRLKAKLRDISKSIITHEALIAEIVEAIRLLLIFDVGEMFFA